MGGLDWVGIIVAGMVFAVLGVWLVLGVAIVSVALVERRPIKLFVPVESDDPEWQSLDAIKRDRGSSNLIAPEPDEPVAGITPRYAETQIRAAIRLGFRSPRLFKMAKGGMYRTYTVLAVSDSCKILAAIRWGSTASIRDRITLLYSFFEDGRYLVTSDRISGTRVRGFSFDLVLQRASFEQLLERHEGRLCDCLDQIRDLAPENPLAEFEALLQAKARFLIQKGDAYWTDPAETEYRSTLRGAFKMYVQTFSAPEVDRDFRPNAG
jgi:hypothetical protein